MSFLFTITTTTLNMGTTFTHFNPLSDENGLDLQERFNTKINHIGEHTNNVCYIFVSDDNKCHKYKINSMADPELMKDYTPLKLFKYIFGHVFKHYIESPQYKNMSEEELLQICDDFAQHLKSSAKVIIHNTADVEKERFSVKYPNNVYAKYADPNKIWFSRILDADTKKTLYFYFQIQVEENGKKYHVVLKHHEFRNVQLTCFDPFDINLQSLANNVLLESEKSNLCIMHFTGNKITLEFYEEQLYIAFSLSPTKFYKLLFGKIYKTYILDELYQNITDEELVKICSDFEIYLEYFKANNIFVEEADKCKYMFHRMFPNNVFSKCFSMVQEEDKIKPYMCKILDETSKKVKYHYLPLKIIANKKKSFNVVVDYNGSELQLNPLIKGTSETS